MFFTKSGRDFGCRVIFELNSAPKIKDSEIILDGTVIFNQEARYGKIHIQNGKAVYIKGKFHYVLEPDKRTKSAWDALLADIQKGLTKRKQFMKMLQNLSHPICGHNKLVVYQGY